MMISQIDATSNLFAGEACFALPAEQAVHWAEGMSSTDTEVFRRLSY